MAGDIKEFEKVFKALANRRRLNILRYLKRVKEAAVSDIGAEIHLSVKSTSRHLTVLAAVELVDKEQRNVQVYYRLAPDCPTAAKQIITLL